MEVIIPEPVGKPIEVYSNFFRCLSLTKSGFGSFLSSIKESLDKVVNEEVILEKGLVILEYDLSIFRSMDGSLVGDVIDGGCFLYSRMSEYNRSFLEELRDSYKRSFSRAKKDYFSHDFVSSNMYVIGARDSISHKVEVVDTFSDEDI